MARDPIIKNRTILDYPFGMGVDPITIPYLAGNGYIYETAGLLVLGCNAGTNMEWRTGNMAYAPFGTPVDADYEIIAETELSSASLVGNNQAWFGLWQDDSNNVWWYCEDAGGIQRAYRITGGSWTSVADGPTMALPAKLRVVWEPHRDRITWYAYVGGVWTSYATIQIAGFKPNRAFLYARTWSSVATEARWNYLTVAANALVRPQPIPVEKMGPTDVVNWQKFTGDQMPGRFARPFPDNSQMGIRLPGQVSDYPSQARGPIDRMSPSDAVSWPNQVTGRKNHTFPHAGEGVGMPGNQLSPQQSGTVAQRSASTDKETFWPSKSTVPRFVGGAAMPRTFRYFLEPFFGYPGEGASYLKSAATGGQSAPSDSLLFAQGAEPFDWATGLNDAEGHEFVTGDNIYEARSGTTVGEAWDAPTPGDGFYGYGRDGTFYYDGYPTGPTLNGVSFGTLLGGYNTKTWCVDTEPAGIASGITQQTMSIIADDHVKFVGNVVQTDWNWGKYLSSRYRWYLTGDFDIEVRFENRSVSGGSDGNTPMFRVQTDEYNWVYVRRHHNNFYDSDVMINNAWGYYVSAATTDASGRLRIVRVGNAISTYYWNNAGSSWTLLRSAITSTVLGRPMHCEIIVAGVGSMTLTRLDVFGFKINSGTVINTAGWYREAAGSHRSSNAAFPRNYALVSTGTSFGIIDTDTNKLWMRFLLATNNALHPWTASTRPWRAAMSNGRLLIATGDNGGAGGSCVIVDFTLDEVQVHRTDADTYTGAFLRAHNGVNFCYPGLAGREVCAEGQISARNLAGAYSGDNNRFRILNNECWAVDVINESGWVYWAVATASGVSLFSWRRLYMDGVGNNGENHWGPRNIKHSLGVVTSMVWFDPASKDLWYETATTLYRVSKADWQAQLATGPDNGNMTPTDSFAVPTGGFTSFTQRSIAIDGSTLYHCSNAGIYRMNNWPTGPWILFFGAPGSGAMFEILPANWTVRHISKAVDSVTLNDLLLIAFARDSRGMIGAVNLDTNAMFGIKPMFNAAIASRLAYQGV